MYFACALLESGFKLKKPPSNGPDLLLAVDAAKLWIEAVAPGPGNGPDAVPGRDKRGYSIDGIWCGHPPPEESLILRCVGALCTKLDKCQSYIAKGVVAPSDRLAIALSLGGVDEAFITSPDIPIVLKALFPIGPHYCRFQSVAPEQSPPGATRTAIWW